MACVASARGKRVSQSEKKEIDAEKWKNQHQVRVGRQIITHCMRANDSRLVEQGVKWARRARSARERGVESRETIESERGCAVCGVKHCDLAHVILARCTGVDAAAEYLRRLEAAFEDILTVLPRAPKDVGCPCRVQVHRAIAVVRRARVCRFADNSYTYSACAAVRRVLGGYIAESSLCEALGKYERRAVEYRVAAAIGNAQDIVYEMMSKYHNHNRAKVAAVRALEEAHWQDTTLGKSADDM